jgi:hypothetical protein
MPTEPRPNFFIVGAQKSGTSGLAGWLSEHPQIFMCFPKEPGYLAFKDNGYPYLDGYGRSAPASEYVVSDEQAYLRLFADTPEDSTLLGEASTWYFAIPGVAQRIKQFSPEAKILIILRNPADRAYSAWCHARRDNLEPCKEFDRALDLEDERGEVEFLLRYHRMGRYSKSLAEYQSLFDASQLKVLLYEDLRDNPELLWQQLCTFLEIERLDEIPRQRRRNRSGQPRFLILQSLMKSHRFRSAIARIIPRRRAARIKEKLDQVNLKRFPPLDDMTRRRLQDYYRQDIEDLSRIAGRDLSAWLS